MKAALSAIAATLFVSGVSAHDVYGEFGIGNSDLFDEHRPTVTVTAVQPSVGDDFDRYHGQADDNPDLFKTDLGGPTNTGDDPRIYGGFQGTPGLTY